MSEAIMIWFIVSANRLTSGTATFHGETIGHHSGRIGSAMSLDERAAQAMARCEAAELVLEAQLGDPPGGNGLLVLAGNAEFRSVCLAK